MKIQENISLAKYTTFKIGGPARFFCSVKNESELVEAVGFAKENGLKIFILGGGSNLLIADKGFDGLVIKMEITGITLGERSRRPAGGAGGGQKGESNVTANAGEVWDDFVAFTVSKGLYGLENLSHIPGSVGAAPVQNVGAYGVEAGSLIISVRALEVETMKFVDLTNAECEFSYRNSMFKKNKGKYIITSTTFKLKENGEVNISYKDLKDYFPSKPSLSEVRKAVIDIRTKKLPDWNNVATAGSYFKNPNIDQIKYDELKKKYPDMPGFPEKDNKVKIPLGWVLDKVCNFKGIKEGKVGTYDKQALVIVGYEGAAANDVKSLGNKLAEMVKEKTGVEIEPEVEYVS